MVEIELFSYFGIKFTAEEVGKLFNALKGYINRDKNYICLGLEITKLNIQDLYDELILKYLGRFTARETKIHVSELKELVYYIKRRTRKELSLMITSSS